VEGTVGDQKRLAEGMIRSCKAATAVPVAPPPGKGRRTLQQPSHGSDLVDRRRPTTQTIPQHITYGDGDGRVRLRAGADRSPCVEVRDQRDFCQAVGRVSRNEFESAEVDATDSGDEKKYFPAPHHHLRGHDQVRAADQPFAASMAAVSLAHGLFCEQTVHLAEVARSQDSRPPRRRNRVATC
jgi:hypothetical protein